jgi:hypothetical protein
MNRLLVALLGAVLAVGFGCHNDDKDMDSNDTSMKASMDACPHCPGVQKATADGKCPVCGAKVSMKADKPGAGVMNDRAGNDTAAAMDACSHCPGVQKVTADGKCPVCGAEVAKK